MLEAGSVSVTTNLAMFVGAEPSADNGFALGTAATLEGALVGVVLAQGVRLDMPVDLSTDLALLDAIAVAEDSRGQGIGSRLLGDTTCRFRSLGHRGMIAKLAAGRRDLIPFYTKAGWSLGLPGAGVVVHSEQGPICLAEDPRVRIARKALTNLAGHPALLT